MKTYNNYNDVNYILLFQIKIKKKKTNLTKKKKSYI